MIGGAARGAGNVISGNVGGAIGLDGATNTTIQGNLIGTNATNTGAPANASGGIRIYRADTTAIGGTASGAANVIEDNGGYGILFSPQANQITGDNGFSIIGNNISNN